nr:hypothetical protein [Tanacetum cinerariifolium]
MVLETKLKSQRSRVWNHQEMLLGLTIYPIKFQDEEEDYIGDIDAVVVFGSRNSTPPSPPHDDHVLAPSPSDSDDDTTFDNEKYSCITLCSLQTCHGGSDMKNCLTSCVDKCRDGDSGAGDGDGGYAFWSHGRGFCSQGGQVNDGGIAKLGEGERDGDGDGLGGK